jgi:hypothetical protein
MSKVDDYVEDFFGWHGEVATMLRDEIMAAGDVTVDFRWGHPVFESNGPVCLFKVHPDYVRLAFWRGTRMQDIEPRLMASGGREMADIKLTSPADITPSTIRLLVQTGMNLNRRYGDPLVDTPRQAISI